jgi:8-oxo-dGTP pyrophosphatase MutT (NUDIX family)
MIAQAAAMPIAGERICLINSSSGRGWVIPKGHIEWNQTARETALREAWEEAGLRGSLEQTPVGIYRYKKNSASYRVEVFLMHVTEMAATWPERHRRSRRWIRPHQIDQFIDVVGLRRVLSRVSVFEAVSAG